MKTKLPQAGFRDRFLYFLGRRRMFLVEGDSMEPTIKNLEVVLVNPMAKIVIGDVVLVAHPYKLSTKIVKRVSAIESDGRLMIVGDNPAESSDSRTFGAVSLESIVGKVICKLS